MATSITYFRTVELPEMLWERCKSCGGRGSYYEEGDLHRSSGIVPCRYCSNGTVKWVEVRGKSSADLDLKVNKLREEWSKKIEK